MARILIITGIVFIVSGLATNLGFGRLPGDISIRGGHFTLFMPIVSSILVSILLTFILNLFMRR